MFEGRLKLQANLLAAGNYITACAGNTESSESASSSVSTETTRRTAAFQKDNDDPAGYQQDTRAIKRTANA